MERVTDESAFKRSVFIVAVLEQGVSLWMPGTRRLERCRLAASAVSTDQGSFQRNCCYR
jgi:hypothetical protein